MSALLLQTVISVTNILDSVMHKTAMHAELAKLCSNQLKIDLDVSDQDQLATASKDTLPMDTLALLVVTDKSKIPETTKDVSQLHNVSDKTNTSVSVMKETASDAELAKLFSFQTMREPDASDQDQCAIASKDTLMMATHAFSAQEDKLLTQETTKHVSQLHHVLDQANILDLEMPKTAMHADLAKPYSSQLKTDPDVIDQDQLATASKDTVLMDMHANNAHQEVLLTQETTKTVFQLQLAVDKTNTQVLVMKEAASNADLAHFHLFQTKLEPDAIDQDQLATASKDTVLMDIHASNAHLEMLLTHKIKLDVSQLALVPDPTNILVTLTTAMLAETAKLFIFQTRTEPDAIDQDHSAHVPKDTVLTDTNA
jgi:hypothetical protein